MAKPRKPEEPREQVETKRQALLRHLQEGPFTARELSGLVQIPEREVASHLEHLARSLRHTDQSLVMEPAQCLACGFVFRDRGRFTRPSACPKCRGQHIEPPAFRVSGGAPQSGQTSSASR